MKINIKYTEKLEKAIEEAQGRATARTVTANEICRILQSVGDGVAKANLSGTKVHYTGAQHFPNAYKYRPDSTHWTAENIRGNWYVTDIWRGACPNRTKWNTEVEYSEIAKEAILESLSRRLCY